MTIIKKVTIGLILLVLMGGCSSKESRVELKKEQKTKLKKRTKKSGSVNIPLAPCTHIGNRPSGYIIKINHSSNTTEITIRSNNRYKSLNTGGKNTVKLNGKIFNYFIINNKQYQFNKNKSSKIKLGKNKVTFVFDKISTAKFNLTEFRKEHYCWNSYNVDSLLEKKDIKKSEYANLPPYSNKIIGAKFKKDVKFYGGKIWQDQPNNAKRYYINYAEAKNYCKSLNLLDIKEWSLPTREDYFLMFKDKKYLNNKKFKFTSTRSGWGTNYWTKDEGCYYPGAGWTSDEIIKNECVWSIDPPNFEDQFSTEKEYYSCLNASLIKEANSNLTSKKHNERYSISSLTNRVNKKRKYSIRCVLNPNIYNLVQKRKQTKYAQKGGLDGYLQAFASTGDKTSMKKALALAKTPNDKAKIEKTLYKYIGGLKVFNIKANGKTITKNLKSSNYDKFLLKSISSHKNLKQRFSISLNKKSSLKLKYNSYKLKMKFKLELEYCTIIDFFNSPKTMCSTKIGYKEAIFNLSKSNNYSMSKTIDFGAVRQGSRSSVLLFQMDESLNSANIDYEIKSTEIKSYYEN